MRHCRNAPWRDRAQLVWSRVSKTGCCSVLSSCRATASQSLALISSVQQSCDEAIKLFEPHRFLVEGEQFLVKLLGAARQTRYG